MLCSRYIFLFIDSENHRQKGKSRIGIYLQKLGCENNLRAVPDGWSTEKDMLETLFCAYIMKNKETDQRK